MKRYEYRTVLVSGKSAFGRSLETSKFDRELNKLGSEGWELVESKAALPGWGADMGVLFVLKRCVSSMQAKKNVLKLDQDWN